MKLAMEGVAIKLFLGAGSLGNQLNTGQQLNDQAWVLDQNTYSRG